MNRSQLVALLAMNALSAVLGGALVWVLVSAGFGAFLASVMCLGIAWRLSFPEGFLPPKEREP